MNAISQRTRNCPMCGGSGELNADPCFECGGRGTILLPAQPHESRQSISAQDQAFARIREMRGALDALEAMVRQCDSLAGARTAVEISRGIVGRARSLESTVIAAAREERRKEAGQA